MIPLVKPVSTFPCRLQKRLACEEVTEDQRSAGKRVGDRRTERKLARALEALPCNTLETHLLAAFVPNPVSFSYRINSIR